MQKVFLSPQKKLRHEILRKVFVGNTRWGIRHIGAFSYSKRTLFHSISNIIDKNQ